MTHDEIISVIQAHKEGKQIQYSRKCAPMFYDLTDDPVWNFEGVDYRIKPAELSREEITAKLVKDNDVKVGSKVMVITDKPFMSKGTIYTVKEINSSSIIGDGYAEELCFSIEEIEKVNSKTVPFTFEDREEFRDKWVRQKGKSQEWRINYITEQGLEAGHLNTPNIRTFEECLDQIEFIDGRSFGKEIWE